MPPTDYAERIERRSMDYAVFLTCEHASERIPDPFRLPEDDAWLVGTHWAYDLGAADLTRELARELGVGAVLSRFSRLLIDPNRSPAAPDLFRKVAEGRPIALNQHVGDVERELRFTMSNAYHAAVDEALAGDPASLVLSIHSFTPVYEGVPRAVEIGVLFDEEEALAESLRDAFARQDFAALLNEPYSGKFGLMYAVERHAKHHARRALELEVRQDLAEQPDVRRRVIAVLKDALAALPPRQLLR